MTKRRFIAVFAALVSVAVAAASYWSLPKTTPAKLGLRAREVFVDPKVVALCHAIDRNDLTEMSQLIAQGADVNARGKGNITPLLWAFFDDHPERFELLLQHGADPNVCLTEHIRKRNGPLSIGTSVTELAAKSSFQQQFGLVMRYGGNPNFVNPRTGKPVMHSVIFRGVDVEQRVRQLIQKGADLDIRDRNGVTPCMQALSSFQQYDIALLLLKEGADHSICSTHGLKLMHMLLRDRKKLPNLARQKSEAHAKLLEWLVAHGENIEEEERFLTDLGKSRMRSNVEVHGATLHQD